MKLKTPYFDSNAWVFESIELTEDILNPKAADVVDMIKEIKRYMKK